VVYEMGMREFLAKRIIQSLLMIFIVITLNFYLFRIMPGDPVDIMFNPVIGPEAKAIMMREMGLDKPLSTQYIIYLKNLLQGKLGYSFLEHNLVWDAILERLPSTILLMFSSNIIAILLGIVLGVLAAWKRGTKVDISSIIVSLTLYSMPMFWLGGLMIILFSVRLRMFPIFGMVTPGASYANIWEYLADVGSHLFLPMMSFGIGTFGGLFLIMRNTMIDAFTEDYTLTAKAIGLDNRTIIFKNVMRNAMLPVITIISLRLGFMVGGAILTETVFSWPGIGLLTYRAVMAHDYQMLQGVFLVITVLVVLANLMADIIYGYADPRVRY
jgi:peptide/nickel transport system permease protein